MNKHEQYKKFLQEMVNFVCANAPPWLHHHSIESFLFQGPPPEMKFQICCVLDQIDFLLEDPNITISKGDELEPNLKVVQPCKS